MRKYWFTPIVTLVTAVMIMATAGSAGAMTLKLVGANDVADLNVTNLYPNTPLGYGPTLVGGNSANGAFNVHSYAMFKPPANAPSGTIVGAYLSVYATRAGYLCVSRVGDPIDELTTTWNNQPVPSNQVQLTEPCAMFTSAGWQLINVGRADLPGWGFDGEYYTPDDYFTVSFNGSYVVASNNSANRPHMYFVIRN